MQIKDDTFLSAHLGCSAFCIKNGSGDVPLLPDRCFAFSKVGVDDLWAAKKLTDRGFFLADTNLRYVYEKSKNIALVHSGIIVRAAEADDEQAVRKIAGSSFVYTRFHSDPYVTKSVADRLKAEWAGNFFDGMRGDAMYVAEKNGEVIGFNQVLFPQSGEAIIDLIAVDREHQRCGAGRAMICDLQTRFDRIVVGTQLANACSIALYESTGFKFDSADYVFHYHGAQR